VVNVNDADDQQLLHHRVNKIKKLCSRVIKGYSKHHEEINSCPLPEQCLNEIKLLFDQRIERRCAENNSTKEEEEQWNQAIKLFTTMNYQIPTTNLRSMI
jgi:hypothetical protein